MHISLPLSIASRSGKMPTLFLALQCCQCSTMQVKQQKRSSNKWVCAVCNQRQSVRRVHAQGALARDLRHFVQAFNMARSVVGHGPDGQGWISPQSEAIQGRYQAERDCSTAKRRTDWSEYLDPKEEEEEEEGGEEEEEEEGDGDVVTELPSEIFGRKWNFPKRPPGAGGTGGSKPLEPNFSKRRQQQELLGRTEGSKRHRATGSGASSRWSEYLEEGEKDESFKEEGSFNLGSNGSCGGDDRLFDDLAVEEEVHPDFK